MVVACQSPAFLSFSIVGSRASGKTSLARGLLDLGLPVVREVGGNKLFLETLHSAEVDWPRSHGNCSKTLLEVSEVHLADLAIRPARYFATRKRNAIIFTVDSSNREDVERILGYWVNIARYHCDVECLFLIAATHTDVLPQADADTLEKRLVQTKLPFEMGSCQVVAAASDFGQRIIRRLRGMLSSDGCVWQHRPLPPIKAVSLQKRRRKYDAANCQRMSPQGCCLPPGNPSETPAFGKRQVCDLANDLGPSEFLEVSPDKKQEVSETVIAMENALPCESVKNPPARCSENQSAAYAAEAGHASPDDTAMPANIVRVPSTTLAPTEDLQCSTSSAKSQNQNNSNNAENQSAAERIQSEMIEGSIDASPLKPAEGTPPSPTDLACGLEEHVSDARHPRPQNDTKSRGPSKSARPMDRLVGFRSKAESMMLDGAARSSDERPSSPVSSLPPLPPPLEDTKSQENQADASPESPSVPPSEGSKSPENQVAPSPVLLSPEVPKSPPEGWAKPSSMVSLPPVLTPLDDIKPTETQLDLSSKLSLPPMSPPRDHSPVSSLPPLPPPSEDRGLSENQRDTSSAAVDAIPPRPDSERSGALVVHQPKAPAQSSQPLSVACRIRWCHALSSLDATGKDDRCMIRNMKGSDLHGASDTRVVVKKVSKSTLEERWGSQDKLAGMLGDVAALQHPHIVPFMGAALDNGCGVEGHLFFISEFFPGPNVEEYLLSLRKPKEKMKPVAPPKIQAFKWAVHLAKALQHLHLKGLIHGKLRLSNLLLVDGLKTLRVTSTPMLSNMACPKNLTEEKIKNRVYFAPEYFQQVPLTVKIDIYAFALIAHSLCSGELPLIDEKGDKLSLNFRLSELSLASDDGWRPTFEKSSASSEMQLLIAKAGQYIPEVRPSAEEVLENLQKIGRKSSKRCCLQ